MRLERNYEEQSKIRNEYKTKIDISRAILTGLKRRAALSMAVETATDGGAAAETKKSKDAGIFDPSKLLKKLRTSIKQIHVD